MNLEKYRRVSTLGEGGDTRTIDRFTCGTPHMKENLNGCTSFPREVMWNYRNSISLEI